MTRRPHPSSGMSVMLSQCTDRRDSDGALNLAGRVAAGLSGSSCWAYLSRVPSGRWQNPVLTNAGKGEIARKLWGHAESTPRRLERWDVGKGSGSGAAQDPRAKFREW